MENVIAARLDRFLISMDCNESFRNIKQSIHHRVTSDHSHVMLQCGNWDPVKFYFKFENWWLQTEGFQTRIKHWWNSFNCDGRPDFILALNLMQKLNILNQLAEREEIHDQRCLTEEEIHVKSALAPEFEEIARNEEAAWRQRSRALWLKQVNKTLYISTELQMLIGDTIILTN